MYVRSLIMNPWPSFAFVHFRILNLTLLTLLLVFGCAEESNPTSSEDLIGMQQIQDQVFLPSSTDSEVNDEDGEGGDGPMVDLVSEWGLPYPAPSMLCQQNDTDGDGFGTHPDCEQQDCDDTNRVIHPESFESCNGVDDDCDGQIDEDLGQRQCGMGLCMIDLPWCLDGVIQACPSPEEQMNEDICNGLDDDCDGQVDENLAMTQCGMGICASFAECIDGVQTECIETSPEVEVCNDLDDDCDGQTDEGTRMSVLEVQYSLLDTFHPDCDGTGENGRIGPGCNAAFKRFCAEQMCTTSGLGPMENSGGLAVALCTRGQNFGIDLVELSTLNSECLPNQRTSLGCNQAFHQACINRGFITGYGPIEG